MTTSLCSKFNSILVLSKSCFVSQIRPHQNEWGMLLALDAKNMPPFHLESMHQILKRQASNVFANSSGLSKISNTLVMLVNSNNILT